MTTQDTQQFSNNQDKVRLYIGIASNRGWAPVFGRSFGSMMLYLGYNHIGGRLDGLQLTVTSQAYLITARQTHLDEALASGATHILYLDDDMTFPHDIVDRMVAHNKPVVTVNYRKKDPDNVLFVCSDINNKPIESRGKTGIEQIFAGGMGATLIDLSKIRHIPKPHFGVIYHKDAGKFIIEDCFFANVMKHNGVDIWVDHDLSQQVGHVGEAEFRISKVNNNTILGPMMTNPEDIIKQGTVGYDPNDLPEGKDNS